MPGTSEKQKHRRISVEQVEIGMYCEDVFNEQDVLILSANIPIASNEQIELLKRLGVKYVEIDLKKGSDVRPAKKEEATPVPKERPADAKVTVAEEMPRAREVYSRTLETARNALKAIRLGQAFPTEQIENMVQEIVGSIMRNSDALLSLSQIKGYDEYTYEHSVNVAILVCSLCHTLGYERSIMMEGGIGGLLHDIGKTWIPEHIVNKPGKFTEAEYAVMKRHPEYGLEIVKDRKGISDLSKQVIVQHHERISGKGYPQGLKGGQIHFMGIIAGLADVYDAMTSNRVYRPAFTPQQSLASIYNGIDDEFPRKISEHFIKLLGVYPVGSFVRLASGEMGVVIRINRDDVLAPDIIMLFSQEGQRLQRPIEYRLMEMIKAAGGERYAIEKSLNPLNFGVNISDYIKGKITVE